MLANNSEQWRMREARFVSGNGCRSLHPRQNPGLPRRALRSSRHSQARVSTCQGSSEGNSRRFVLENCERLCVDHSVEWVVGAACADTEAIDEEKEERGLTIS